jgi:serine/threonine protein kinase
LTTTHLIEGLSRARSPPGAAGRNQGTTRALNAQSRRTTARFDREAKAIAALSHPNILAIHDFGSDGGIVYAVTELLDGQTLRDRLRVAALPWPKAVAIAIALAEGLAAAHSKRVIYP